MEKQKQNSLNSFNISTSSTYQPQKDYLLSLLNDLDGVQQNPQYHPEIDALYHSLQVFQIAANETGNLLMLTAALFHDIGKSINSNNHAVIGAEMLRGVLSEPVLWLIEHHLDLLLHPKRTRNNLKNSPQLIQLEMLRRWDIQGREINTEVIDPGLAIKLITQTDEIFQLNK